MKYRHTLRLVAATAIPSFRGCLIGGVMAALAGAAWAAEPKTVEPPPNAPAVVEWKAGQGRLSLRYHGGVILEATVGAEDASGRAVSGAGVKLERTETPGEKAEQRLKFTLAEPQEGATLVLRGTVTGSEEAFPAETDGAAQNRFPLVRTCVGLSHNMRNNAVYDRRWDWVLRQTLIDRNDLRTTLKESKEPFLYPEYDWEKKGFTADTTVANTLVPFKGQWLLYYGAADRCIGLAVFTPGAGSPFSLK